MFGYYQVRKVFSDRLTIIMNSNARFLNHFQAKLAQFNSQGVLVDSFQEAIAQCIVDSVDPDS